MLEVLSFLGAQTTGPRLAVPVPDSGGMHWEVYYTRLKDMMCLDVNVSCCLDQALSTVPSQEASKQASKETYDLQPLLGKGTNAAS